MAVTMRTTWRIRAMGKTRAFRVVPFSPTKNESLKSAGTGGALMGFLASAMMLTSCSGYYRNTQQLV